MLQKLSLRNNEINSDENVSFFPETLTSSVIQHPVPSIERVRPRRNICVIYSSVIVTVITVLFVTYLKIEDAYKSKPEFEEYLKA